MSLHVQKAAVLGAGVMGAQIAAHLANVGIPVMLLDIVPNQLSPEEAAKGLTLQDRQVRNRLAANGLAAARKAKPAAFYDAADEALITIGNMEDDLEQLKDCDWVIEAVVERLDIKREVLAKLAAVLPEHAIVSTNTSGISLAAMVDGLDSSFRKRFLGTHFFNPPRYMKLLEIIPGPETDAQLVSEMKQFAERRLGKGVVIAKDTPNFIANRIGTYGLLVTLQAMERYGLGVDEVDALTGPVLGRPKSATFRTLDLVGIDTFVHVAKNVLHSVTDAAEKKVLKCPITLRRWWLTVGSVKRRVRGFSNERRQIREGNSRARSRHHDVPPPSQDFFCVFRGCEKCEEFERQTASARLRQRCGVAVCLGRREADAAVHCSSAV